MSKSQALSTGTAKGTFSLLVIARENFVSLSLPAGPVVVIGSAAECEVVLAEPGVSDRHLLLRTEPELTVTRVEGASDVEIASHRLASGEKVVLQTGQPIRLGEVLLIVQRTPPASTARHLVTHDYFQARVDEECSRATRFRTSFALMRVRLAHHEIGADSDARMAHLLRSVDVISLYAPGTYYVLLTDMSRAGAEIVVARMEAALDSKCHLAFWQEDGKTAHELLARLGERNSTSPPEGATDAGPAAWLSQAMPVLERIATSQITVLILGETGAGKGHLAQHIHRLSPRAAAPFVALDVAALPESLLEGELFGYERGAFTGAVRSKPGIFEAADGGTIFLDEIGELPLPVQVKLLRILETRQVVRLGSTALRSIDVRLLAATNRDLEAEVRLGRFRSDLFFRLNGFAVVVPPLRDRAAEILELANAFVHQFAVREKREGLRLSAESINTLLKHSWPGNIRELRNVIERAVILCQGTRIGVEHLSLGSSALVLPSDRTRSSETVPEPPTSRHRALASSDPSPAEFSHEPPTEKRQALLEQLEVVERMHLVEVLTACAWNQNAAAAALKISRRTLTNQMNRYRISGPRKKRD